MKIGIIGLPQTGKKTLFQILTQNELKEHAGAMDPVPGTADILDTRFDTLVNIYSPKSRIRARIDLVLLPKIEQETISRGDIFRDIADMDAVCHVVRAFKDEAVYHEKGSVNPVRDAEMVSSELIIHDQIFVEKRIERIQETLKKKKDKEQLKELALMEKMQKHLEKEKPLRLMELTLDEDFMIRSYPFITRKEMILALNVSEGDLDDTTLLDKFKVQCESKQMEAMLVSAKVESEIALLDTKEEKAEFLEELGIKETALGTLTRLCLKALGQISFFTVGTDEVRQWLVKKDSAAPVAAGVIHSDLQKGFIRAEVIKYDELMEFGSEAELKKNGKMYLQGKDYTVADGDILNIRFNV
ncbi:MAG: redox-regulated ATPase YchF [Thermodesulfobacteriota bacterium]|nr:redox-regulated ATPase YchF [Thermodesulfobacteriota bacterium]